MQAEDAPITSSSDGAAPRRKAEHGERSFRAINRPLQRISAWCTALTGRRCNPLLYTGACANLSLLVAVLSGVAMLWWYVPSVHRAYDSLQSMGSLGRFTRSLHRYSSDAAVVFVLLHVLKIVAARRFFAARWFAWATGFFALLSLWITGWLGYWLVWDEPAREIALATATLLDVIPIFVEPVLRGFITDSQVNSLLFFVIFFLHMLLPLALTVLLWLHIARLARAQWMPTRPLVVLCVAALVMLSLLAPAAAGPPARMLEMPRTMALDYWYLWPLLILQRLNGAAGWTVLAGGTLLVVLLPKLLLRERPKAAVVTSSRCNACMQCIADCPYDAISLRPRNDGKPLAGEAFVADDRCVSCGICSGSCNSAAIDLPFFRALDQRKRMDAALEKACAGSTPLALALLCGESAGHAVAEPFDPRMPGYYIMKVPCAGWIHTAFIERALRRKAPAVLIGACAPGECRNREGGELLDQRLFHGREPALHPSVDRTKIEVLELPPSASARLFAAARRLDERRTAPEKRIRWTATHARQALSSMLCMLVGAFVLLEGSRAAYTTPYGADPELVISFKHPGKVQERCETVSTAEQAALPSHMRVAKRCDRSRAPVSLTVSIDGAPIFEEKYEPAGLWRDGDSTALELLKVPAGEREVRVVIEDDVEGRAQYVDERKVIFAAGERNVVLFSRSNGFSWHSTKEG